jgi:hypothetical protein
MKSKDWKGTVELVGIFAVVASLVFVGVEVRQNSVATRSATNAAVKDAFSELNLTIASSPELARAMVTLAENPDDALPEDQLRVLALWRALFHGWSNVHRQHLNGTIDPALYDAVVQEISAYAGKFHGPVVPNDVERRKRQMRWAWESERFVFNPDFQLFVDDVIGVER